MPDNSKIKTIIKCQNIAPLVNLEKEIQSNSLKIAVFANNGGGKTFISRLFRMLVKQKPLEPNEDGTSPTDKLLSFGKTTGNFSFKVIDQSNTVQEDTTISFVEKSVPTIPTAQYLYHTFNQDYVEDNIRALGYEKNSDIEGFILGKANIDLKDDEDKLVIIEEEAKSLKERINNEINQYLENNIDSISNIKRLDEYKKLLNPQSVFNGVNIDKQNVSKTFDELLADYNKIKSVPENLPDIPQIKKIDIGFQYFIEIKDNALKEYSLSTLADEFKQKIKIKQAFIETGLGLYNHTDGVCPFCEQKIQDSAIVLIDDYTKFLSDTESQTIKLFQSYSKSITELIVRLKTLEAENSKQINSYNEYKTKYIPSCENTDLEKVTIEGLTNSLLQVIETINIKLQNISIAAKINDELLSDLQEHGGILDKITDDNNEKIRDINSKKNRISDENRSVRKELCKCAYNYLVETHSTNIKKANKYQDDWRKLNSEINKKKEEEKVSKKSKVASTIKTVLNYFFSDKYTLDEDSFRLVFNKTTLVKGQVKNVLSEGEKNIIAFAYYVGDTHMKVENEDDYEKLFFIIDDPISSMDFSHVYTLCGVIRDIKRIFDKLTRERFIIFTHNNDFMRIISANNIVDKNLILKNGSITEFNNNLTVPYVSHLLDIHKIARRGEKANHTTANSIRHIIETLTKFQNIENSTGSISEYIRENIPDDSKSYTLIQDLSHGAWRSEQQPITDDDYQDICETIIKHIEYRFAKQIEYCDKCNN